MRDIVIRVDYTHGNYKTVSVGTLKTKAYIGENTNPRSEYCGHVVATFPASNVLIISKNKQTDEHKFGKPLRYANGNLWLDINEADHIKNLKWVVDVYDFEDNSEEGYKQFKCKSTKQTINRRVLSLMRLVNKLLEEE